MDEPPYPNFQVSSLLRDEMQVPPQIRDHLERSVQLHQPCWAQSGDHLSHLAMGTSAGQADVHDDRLPRSSLISPPPSPHPQDREQPTIILYSINQDSCSLYELQFINSNNPANNIMKAIPILLLFTVAMFAVPLGGFYLSKEYIFEGRRPSLLSKFTRLILGFLGYQNGTVGAGILAVMLVHVIIAVYIYVAWIEGGEQRDTLKQD